MSTKQTGLLRQIANDIEVHGDNFQAMYHYDMSGYYEDFYNQHQLVSMVLDYPFHVRRKPRHWELMQEYDCNIKTDSSEAQNWMMLNNFAQWVRFKAGDIFAFDETREFKRDPLPKIKTFDWTGVPVDTLIYAKDSGELAHRCYFAKVSGGKILVFGYGCTSKTASGDLVAYELARIAESDWIMHHGGKCHLPNETVISIKTANEHRERCSRPVIEYNWLVRYGDSKIIAYKICEQTEFATPGVAK